MEAAYSSVDIQLRQFDESDEVLTAVAQDIGGFLHALSSLLQGAMAPLIGQILQVIDQLLLTHTGLLAVIVVIMILGVVLTAWQ